MATANPLIPTAVESTNGVANVEYRDDLSLKIMCPVCKELPPNITEEFSSGDVVCLSCGLVLGDRIVDTRSEWRTFSNDDQGNDDPSRVGEGANPLLNGSQLTTTISFGDGGSGRSRDLHRAQNKATHDKSTKGLLEAYKEIGAFCEGLHVTKLAADMAKHIYKLIDDAKAFKGKGPGVVEAGCIFIACRQAKTGRSFREVSAVTKIPKKEIGRIYKHIEKFYQGLNKEEMHLVVAEENIGNSPTTDPQQLCVRYCSTLRLGNLARFLSEQLAERMSKVGALAGRSPLSSAAACIYMVSHLLNIPKTPKEIALVAGVSDGTIRTSYKFLYNKRDELIPEAWIKEKKVDMSKLPVG